MWAIFHGVAEIFAAFSVREGSRTRAIHQMAAAQTASGPHPTGSNGTERAARSSIVTRWGR